MQDLKRQEGGYGFVLEETNKGLLQEWHYKIHGPTKLMLFYLAKPGWQSVFIDYLVGSGIYQKAQF